jgi:hypothetical protein
MCKRILRTFANTEIFGVVAINLQCDEVRERKEEIFERYRRVNKTDRLTNSGMIDKYYEQFKESMEQFLSQCDDNLKLQCDTCKKKDHDGVFCRCEDRNIALAKKQRKEGKSPWGKNPS